MENLEKAILDKLCTAKGKEHELYESMVMGSCGSSFEFGAKVTLYALSQELGEDVVNDAIQKWLSK